MFRAGAVITSVALAVLRIATPAEAQLFLSLNSLASPVVEDFNGLGSAFDAQLPSGWTLSPDSNPFGTNYTNRSAGTTGSGAVSIMSLSGYYNFADGENATSTDRAVGILSNLTFSTNRSLFVALLNNSGSPITQLHLSYDIEKYRTGLVSHDMKLFYGFDGATWTELPDGMHHYNADAQIAAVHPPGSISKAISLSGLSVAHQDRLFLRWRFSSASLNNAQALAVDNVTIAFDATSLPRNLTWAGPNAGAWDNSSSNWKDHNGAAAQWNDLAPDRAIFATPAPGVGTSINISAPKTAGGITFDSIQSYTIAPGSPSGSLTLLSEVHVASGSHVISSPLLLQNNTTVQTDPGSSLGISGPLSLSPAKTLQKTGRGTLRLSGPLSFGNDTALDIAAGTLRLDSNIAAPGNPTARVQIRQDGAGSDALVVLGADQDWKALTLTNGPGRQGLDLNSPAAPGAFRSLRVHATDLQTTKFALAASIRNAAANPGDGIFDSGLAAHPNSALGIAIVDNQILLRPTRLGDLNLDGRVTISDFIDLAASFNRSGVTWQEGDLNNDNNVTISDFIDLASNFNATYSGEIFPISPAEQTALNAFAAAQGISIPEPPAAWFTMLVALSIFKRRRLQSLK